jgi:hypothetical protein
MAQSLKTKAMFNEEPPTLVNLLICGMNLKVILMNPKKEFCNSQNPPWAFSSYGGVFGVMY